MFTGNMPDITLAQSTAVVGWIVAQAVAFGVLDVRYQQLAVSAGATVLAVALKASDAWLRGKRVTALKPATAPVAGAPVTTPPAT